MARRDEAVFDVKLFAEAVEDMFARGYPITVDHSGARRRHDHARRSVLRPIYC
jgi:hypothetical protein